MSRMATSVDCSSSVHRSAADRRVDAGELVEEEVAINSGCNITDEEKMRQQGLPMEDASGEAVLASDAASQIAHSRWDFTCDRLSYAERNSHSGDCFACLPAYLRAAA